MWALLSVLVLLPILGVLFFKGNMKLARIIFCFYLTVLTTIWAFVSQIYLILLFALPCLIMGIVCIVVDDETNVWGRDKKQRNKKFANSQNDYVVLTKEETKKLVKNELKSFFECDDDIAQRYYLALDHSFLVYEFFFAKTEKERIAIVDKAMIKYREWEKNKDD